MALKSVSDRSYVLMYSENEAVVLSLDEDVHTITLCKTKKAVDFCISLHHTFATCSVNEVAEQFDIISKETDEMFHKS